MKNLFAAVALLTIVAGCAVDRGGSQAQQQNAVINDAKPSRDIFAIGSDLLPTGAIAADSTAATFTRGGEIFLSVDVGAASTSQAIDVDWIDGSGRVVRRERRMVPVGARYAAFSSGSTARWGHGPYRVVVGINGRRVSEREFAIT